MLVFKASSVRLQRNNFSSSKTSSRRPAKTPWRHLTSTRHPEDVSWTRLKDALEDKKLLRWRCLQDVVKTYLEDVLKTCLENVLKICLEDVLKTCLEDVCNTFWKQTKFLLELSVSNKSKCTPNKSIFYKSKSDESKVNPKCID